MKDIRSVRKLNLGGDVVCIAEELFEYLGINTPINVIVSERGLLKDLDFEVLPIFLIEASINLDRYTDKSTVMILKKSAIYKIIRSRRDVKCIKIGKRFDIEVNHIKERAYLDIIISAFNGLYCKQNYHVKKPNSNGYYVDLFISDGVNNVVVEIDENGHRYYDSEYELERQLYIEKALNSSIIRFNPDDKSTNVGDVIREIGYHFKQVDTHVDSHVEFIDIWDGAEIVQDIFHRMNQVSPNIVDFIRELQVEGLCTDMQVHISLIPDIAYTNEFFIVVNEVPWLHTKDIVSQKIIDNGLEIYVHSGLDKSVFIKYKIVETTISINSDTNGYGHNGQSMRYIRYLINELNNNSANKAHCLNNLKTNN